LPPPKRCAWARHGGDGEAARLRHDPAHGGSRHPDARQCATGHHQALDLTNHYAGTPIYTDEYTIYSRLEAWGYPHKTVNHSAGEYARDEDGDGFCEVHSNTMEGFWSLLRSWLRPHRGLSQAKLPLYLSFFEFVHNVRKRGKGLLSSLLAVLVKKTPKPI